MLTHKQVWEALDKLAARQGLSPSGLAKRAGLDPTAFNKSKRVSADDKARPRWPSTESVAKVLEATGATLEDFASLAAGARAKLAQGQGMPVLSLKDASNDTTVFDSKGTPASAIHHIQVPDWSSQAWGLEVTGNGFAPAYRNGDMLIVDPNADIHAGDRVVLRTTSGQMHVMTLDERDTDQIDLSPLNPLADPLHIKSSDVAFIARVVWASQ
jgi:phage repressor protein C with HTH and peptisase S24 domain